MTCARCGHRNPASFAFCGGCGVPRALAEGPPGSRADGGRTIVLPEPVDVPAPRRGAGPPPRPAGASASATATDTTRYLCAAVHLDGLLATRLVREILDRRHRALGPSSGVDVGMVLRHALAARRRHLLLEVALLVLGVLVVLVLALRPDAVLLLGALVLAWVLVVAESYTATYAVLARTLQRQSFRPEAAPAPLDPQTERQVQDLAQATDGNVTVYSGFSPFVGGGLSRPGWSFVIDVGRPRDEGDTTTGFGVDELYARVRAAVERLEIDELDVQDRLFVNGQDIRNDGRFLPDPYGRPVSWVPDAVVLDCMTRSENVARHYLWIRLAGWRGELVANLYLRMSLRGTMLFLEASYAVLVPLAPACYEVDRLLPYPSPGQLWRLGVRSARALPRLAWHAAPDVGRAAFRPLTVQWRLAAEQRAIRSDLGFDYGATTTVREAAAGTEYRRYFQRLDEDMYLKVVQERVFSTIAAFLDEHGVDLGELVQRQTTILNNGVMVSGSAKVSVGSLAVGDGARSTLRSRFVPDRSSTTAPPRGGPA